MFDKFFSARPNYSEIFSSDESIHEYLYRDRAKTASVLGDEDFINAWLSSANSGRVTSVIRRAAMSGDIPSIKQMIWLTDLYFDDAENQTSDVGQQLKIKVLSLQDRILFCQKAIESGLTDRSYVAMASCAKLYMLLSPMPNSMESDIVRNALAGIMKYGNMFLRSGTGDPDLIKDTEEALAHYGVFAQVFEKSTA